MQFSDLYDINNLKHGLCTVIAVALLSYIVPAILPEDENKDSMLSKINNVFSTIQESPIPVFVVVFVGCIIGGVVCSSNMGVVGSPQ